MGSMIIVLGMGEVGKPLYEIIGERFDTIGVDIEPLEVDRQCDIMHICYPFQSSEFIQASVGYINNYNPSLTIINSTVPVGTTRIIEKRTSKPVVHSPVRGKHSKMKSDLFHYTKDIAGTEYANSLRAAEHFQCCGIKTKILSSPEATELAKLTETSYFGLLIAWAQEVERYCEQLDLNYDEVVSFYEEIKFLPQVRYFPGVIGGHCVLPNIDILRAQVEAPLLDAIVSSNHRKIQVMQTNAEDQVEGDQKRSGSASTGRPQSDLGPPCSDEFKGDTPPIIAPNSGLPTAAR